MSGGISKNPLNDISQLYLDTVAKVKDAEVKQDIERWSVDEAKVDTGSAEAKASARNKRNTPPGKDYDFDNKVFYARKEGESLESARTRKRRDAHAAKRGVKEGFSRWRAEMREVVDQDVAAFLDRPETEKKAEKEVVEKKVKNKVVINPTLSDAVELLGGELIEVKVSEEKKVVKKEVTALQKAAKTLRGKYVAKADKVEEGLGVALGAIGGGTLAAAGGVAAGAIKGAGAMTAATQQAAGKNLAQAKKERARQQVADKEAQDIKRAGGVTEEFEAAVEYFYEQGINEEGIDLIIEEVGLEDFVDFVDFIHDETIFLNEERAARRATVRAKSYADVKAAVDKSDAAKKKAKKGEYAPSYAKKETDVTVYDEAPKPPAKKKAPAGMKKAVARKKEVLKQPVKKVAPKPVAKKVEKAVAKVKPAQPKKPASKQGLRDKITTAYKAGVKRHKKAVQPARVFAKGMKAGAKSAVKFAGKAKKALVGEKLDYDPMDDPDFDPREAEKKRGVSGKNNPKGGKKLKDIVKESGWHRRNPDKVGTPADPDFNVLKGKGKPVKDSKPSTTGKASKQPPGIYKPNKEGKFVKVSEDKAFDNVVSALRKKHGKDAVITKDSPKPKAKPLNAKQIWKRDNRDAIQREIDAQYGRTPWNKKGSLGT